MRKLSLSTRILLGIFLGILVGLFFGERVEWMSIPGDAFIGLLQMTVLPYIMFSLIVNIGRMPAGEGMRMIRYGVLFLTLLLLIGVLFLAVLPLAFPEWGTGNFYSSDFVEQSAVFDFVKHYIPANPFESLSQNVVPAVVLFSIFVGIGVMGISNRETLLKPLDVLIEGLNQVNKMVVKITPIGVFCIGAGVISQLSWAELSRLQGYLLIYLLAVLILTFVVLPYLIAIFTPFSPRMVLSTAKSTLITIFATGKIIVVYPQLIEDVKKVFKSNPDTRKEALSEVDIILPLAYPFPNLGTFMIFIFVPFAAWYTGNALLPSDYPVFLSSTLLSSFVAPITGLPFSLDLMSIPEETFQLFVVSSVLTDRIRVVLGAVHLITLAILTICASQGMLRFRPRKLLEAIIVTVLLSVACIIGLRMFLAKSMESIPTNEDLINQFSLISPERDVIVLERGERNPSRKYRGENTLSRIKRRGKIRVGLYRKSIPFAFYNRDSLLVGYGVDLAHQLAADLNAGIEFVPINSGELITNVEDDYVDIIMSDIFLSSKYAEALELSKPYMNVTLALLTHKDATDFNDFSKASKLDTFTIAYFERSEIASEFLSYFPRGASYGVKDLDEFFLGYALPEIDSVAILSDSARLDTVFFDGLLTSAERAAALTVTHPEYQVSNPLPYHLSNALVFPLARDDVWRRYVNNWIDYRTKDGTFERVYDQWILGKEYKPDQRIWNVWDDVIMANSRAEEADGKSDDSE